VQAAHNRLGFAGLPLLLKPDPTPAIAPTASTHQQRWADHAAGDPEPVVGSLNRAWFRLLRDGPATFVVTVGAGGSAGYRSWNEVLADGTAARERFGNNQDFFEQQLAEDLRLWYRVEWSPAVAVDHQVLKGSVQGFGSWASSGLVVKYDSYGTDRFIATGRARMINQGGTIAWIQRLRTPPLDW
nr:hypothetical protein [Planctomycetota bacterium]